MAAKSKLRNKVSLSKAHKDSLLKEVNAYTSTFALAAKWADSKKSVAYVKSRDNDKKGVNYIYEFYCYIRIACDLEKNYFVLYKEGIGKNKHKFPQAASVKYGKPHFVFYDKKDKKTEQFQYCAGIRIKGKHPSEKDHPDISFLLPSAKVNPDQDDVILILDAKFQMDGASRLNKGEVDKFESIVRRLKLNSTKLKSRIKFYAFEEFEGNCLLTNARFHYEEGAELDSRLKEEYIKEVQKFYPFEKYKVSPEK